MEKMISFVVMQTTFKKNKQNKEQKKENMFYFVCESQIKCV